MAAIRSRLDPSEEGFRRNRAHMLGLVEQLRSLEARTRAES
jgi:hypothetical protein